jgi:hypothetical protein
MVVALFLKCFDDLRTSKALWRRVFSRAYHRSLAAYELGTCVDRNNSFSSLASIHHRLPETFTGNTKPLKLQPSEALTHRRLQPKKETAQVFTTITNLLMRDFSSDFVLKCHEFAPRSIGADGKSISSQCFYTHCCCQFINFKFLLNRAEAFAIFLPLRFWFGEDGLVSQSDFLSLLGSSRRW